MEINYFLLIILGILLISGCITKEKIVEKKSENETSKIPIIKKSMKNITKDNITKDKTKKEIFG